MPALKVFGLRTKVAGDDLQPLNAFTILIRIVEIILCVPVFTFVLNDLPYQECYGWTDGEIKRFSIFAITYTSVTIFFCLWSFVFECAMFIISSRGSPTQPEKRQSLVPFVFCKLFILPPFLFLIAAVGLVVLGYRAFNPDCINENTGRPEFSRGKQIWWDIAVSAMVVFQFVEVGLFFVYYYSIVKWLILKLLKKRSSQVVDEEDVLEQAVEKCERKCRRCCCCCGASCCFSFGGLTMHREDFSSMATVITDFFDDGGMLDLVLSDIVMAFLAFILVQEQRRIDCLQVLKSAVGGSGAGGDVLGDLDNHSSCLLMVNGVSKRLLQSLPPSSSVDDVDAILEGGGGEEDIIKQSEEEAELKKSPKRRRRAQSLFYKAHRDERDRVHYNFKVRDLLSRDDDNDKFVISEGAWFFKYPVAINTWKNYIFMKPFTGVCELGYTSFRRKLRQFAWMCGSSPAQAMSKKITIGENCFGFHESALMRVAGLDESDVELVYANFNNSVEEAIYCIIIDHRWKSVVLCIRGSLSLEDYVVNISIDPESMEDMGEEFGFDGRDQYCHEGFLNRSKWVFHDLERHGTLSRLLLGASALYKDYTLRVVGHSLGAACAAIVAIMLRKNYPNLRCLCYGPPGCLMSMNIAQYCKRFVTTYILNDDIIPRSSVQNMELLRNELVELIARVQKPKYHVVATYSRVRQGDQLRENREEELADAIEDILAPNSESSAPLTTEYKRHLDRFLSLQRNRKEVRGLSRSQPLHPPGRIVHIVRTSSKMRRTIPSALAFKLFNCVTCDKLKSSREYTPIWAEIDDFNEVVASSSSISDHLIDSVEPELNNMAESFGIDPSHPPPQPVHIRNDF